MVTTHGWGTDTLWVYHTRRGLDGQARQTESTSISAVELARLRRSLNLIVRVIVTPDGRRSLHVEWARRGRSGLTLDDSTGCWRGMPERIEMACYDGLSEAEQNAIEQATPTNFASREDAIAWGFEQGVFNDAVHAANAYEEVKRTHQPKHSTEMWRLWIAEVRQRQEEQAANPFDDPTLGASAAQRQAATNRV